MSAPRVDMQVLRAEVARVARGSDVIDRTLEIVSLVDAVAAPLGIHPVVVGGMAVYFWTASDRFTTYDIDVVMEMPEELSQRLAELGFTRTPDLRHWTLEGTEVFLEAPSSKLDQEAVVAEIELRSNRTVRIISRLDMLIDRLDEFEATGHEAAAQQALALLAGLSEDEGQELDDRAARRGVVVILQAMLRLADDLKAGGTPPDSGELHEIARAALRSEYPPRKP